MALNLTHPIVLNIPELPFPMKDIYRRIGMPEEKVAKHAGVLKMLESALDISKPLIKSKAVFKFLQQETITERCISFKNSMFKICSQQVCKLLQPCPFAVIFMSTIGEALEQKSHEMSRQGDMTMAFLLDAIASETADAVADYVHHQAIHSKVMKEGYQATPRFSPGYGDWPITVQAEILALCEGERIDISVTETSLMIPRKSVSAVFGLKRIQKQESRIKIND